MFPKTLATVLARLCADSADWSFMGPPLIFLLGGSESRGGPRPRLCGLDVAIARLGIRHERPDQGASGRRDLLDRVIEHHLVGLGRAGEPAQLAYELKRGRAYLLVGCGRLEVEQGLDASTHDSSGRLAQERLFVLVTRPLCHLDGRHARNPA